MTDLKYDAKRLEILSLVFHEDALRLGPILPVAEGPVNRCGIPEHNGDGALHITHTAAGWNNPLIVIHEFAHAYCAWKWPELTAAASDLSCETYAALAEFQAVQASQVLLPYLNGRMWLQGVAERLNELIALGHLNLTLDETAALVLTSEA